MKVFLRHGFLSSADAMAELAGRFRKLPAVTGVDNEDYPWRDPVVQSGIGLAEQVLDGGETSRVLLVGHSQGGLVCRVAAIALKGEPRGTQGLSTKDILDWRKEHRGDIDRIVGLGVVTIGTPNCGALALGQMSITTELAARALLRLSDYAGLSDLRDLTTPRLFREFEHWSVDARYLSVSGVRVNRFRKGLFDRAADVRPADRLAVRLEKPNDGIVEDGSTDLRQALIRPEVDTERCYRHVRTYTNSIELGHCDLQGSADVFEVIKNNLPWLGDRCTK